MTLDQQLSERHEGNEAWRCGGCGSQNLMVCDIAKLDTVYATCMDCERLQEVEQRDWPLSEMCDNCAFRKGSPERADPYRWAEVMETLETEQPFHCHKGLSMTAPDKNLTVQFEAPDPTKGRVKVCAGWFAMYVKRFDNQATSE